MTKTLTEQWRDGTLPEGCYYVEFYTEKAPHIEICGNQYLGYLAEFNGTDRAEVLAPVPDYEKVKEMSQKIERLEFDNEALEMAHNEGKEINAELVSKTEQLEKKLAIAIKALKEYADRTNWIEGNFMCVYDRKCFADEESAEEALKEMEGVK